MKTRINQWGNSLAVRIPKVFAVELGIVSGEEVELDLKDGFMMISPTDPSLDSLLKKITPENLHEEVDTGDACGREIW